MSENATEATVQATALNGTTLKTIDPIAVAKLKGLADAIKAITNGTDVNINSADEVKDEAYGKVQLIWNDYAETLRTARFSFPLNRDQYDFFVDVLTKQLSYGVDELFVAMKFREEFLDIQRPGPGPRRQLTEYFLTSETMVLAYHLLSKHKVKGLGSSADHFGAVLRGIGQVSTEFNAFDNESKRLSAAISDFFAGITPLDDTYTEGAEPEAVDAEPGQDDSDLPMEGGADEEVVTESAEG